MVLCLSNVVVWNCITSSVRRYFIFHFLASLKQTSPHCTVVRIIGILVKYLYSFSQHGRVNHMKRILMTILISCFLRELTRGALREIYPQDRRYFRNLNFVSYQFSRMVPACYDSIRLENA